MARQYRIISQYSLHLESKIDVAHIIIKLNIGNIIIHYFL